MKSQLSSLCQGVVHLGEDNVERVAVCAATELLLPPGVTDADSFDKIILLNLSLQFRQAARLSDNHIVATLEIPYRTHNKR